jgi:putative addiction module killer protein
VTTPLDGQLAILYPGGYIVRPVNTILRTAAFDTRLTKLEDPVGEGVSEMRIHAGRGYRLYFTRTGDVVTVLLCGGTKGGQARDIDKAKTYAKQLRNEP